MTLSVLTDVQIRALLENLTVEELVGFQRELRGALHEYSTATQTDHVDGVQQPERTTVHSAETGATTLFMPSSSSVGNGVKGASPPLPRLYPDHPGRTYLPH